jgi:hypothetical protein
MFRKVRDELEHLLDDEMDMAEMYLTEKLTQQEISEASSGVEVDDPAQTEEDRQVITARCFFKEQNIAQSSYP